MRIGTFILVTTFFALPVTQSRPESTPSNETEAITELHRLKTAIGGDAWDSITRISADGQKTSFALEGQFHSVEDLTKGFFEATGSYGLFSNSDGIDHAGRWRKDNSGQIHPLDSAEAQEVAVSLSYLAARGYLFPERTAASFAMINPAKEGAATFLRLVATPPHARAVTLWIDRATHLLNRAVLELSVGTRVVRYSDYRAEGAVKLPFTISIENRDENETGEAHIRKYEISNASNLAEIVRPSSTISDVAMAADVKLARAEGYLDPRTSFFIVYASINGTRSLPFILDTGGHAILTPQAALQLHLHAAGKGFTTGAGAGSTQTEFTNVNYVSIGSATVSNQPFTVLHLDLGTTRNGSGKAQPIAGILGLELFERFVVTLDFKGHSVTLHSFSGPLEESPHGTPLPIRFTSDMPVVVASIDDQSGWFDLDTGNNADLILFPAWASAHGFAAQYDKGAEMNGNAAGGEVHLRTGHARSIQLGDKRLEGIDIMLAGENQGSLSAHWEAGNIGTSILSHYKVTFDYRSELMYLE